MLVRGDVLRGKLRNDRARPEPFTPNEVTPLEFQLNDVMHTFLREHRIMVHVQSSWFPLVDRNPQAFVDIYHAEASDFHEATQYVYHSKAHPSGLVLEVVKP